MKKQFFHMRNREECEQLRDAIVELLEGKEYLFAKTTDKHADIELKLNHSLRKNDYGQYVYFIEFDDEIYSLCITDSYGIHYFVSKEFDHAHINWGVGYIEFHFTLTFFGDVIEKVYKVFRITGELDQD